MIILTTNNPIPLNPLPLNLRVDATEHAPVVQHLRPRNPRPWSNTGQTGQIGHIGSKRVEMAEYRSMLVNAGQCWSILVKKVNNDLVRGQYWSILVKCCSILVNAGQCCQCWSTLVKKVNNDQYGPAPFPSPRLSSNLRQSIALRFRTGPYWSVGQHTRGSASARALDLDDAVAGL